MRSERAAIGLSVHTGWAICVVAGGTLRAPRLALRERLEVLGDADRFVFHMAAATSLDRAKSDVARAAKEARRRAADALREVIATIGKESVEVAACAIVAKDGPMPGTLSEILAAHPRIHTAEGCFFRDALRDAAGACGLAACVISPRDVEPRAATTLRVPLDEVSVLLAAAGRTVGRPWSKDVRQASLAAWIALKEKR
jgi:hypothetical protein